MCIPHIKSRISLKNIPRPRSPVGSSATPGANVAPSGKNYDGYIDPVPSQRFGIGCLLGCKGVQTQTCSPICPASYYG